MSQPADIPALIKQQGILPLFYHDDKDVSTAVISALYSAGIKTIEYTNRGAQALDNFSYLSAQRDALWPGLQLGIGTIKDASSATDFAKAGADYIISPGFSTQVAAAAKDAGLPFVPGCMTPSEIMQAEQHGVQLVKLFPGNLLGPAFVSAVKEVFPRLQFMPTGGVEVSEENMGAWFKSGVIAVGLGSKLVSKALLEKRDYAAIENLTRQALAIVARVR
ncbi:bifunctional 4-hydroxy-2-oxoglutarate aldolase/2-dehydro-3-deoxy-phosphogluconate aldolase [Foetidibacter luteolus]|uniref:bifunctional 4-hydroxy-2-oxoglutarate aldolase/2-dehydro-3-deoxy-phosphogluconate aldolase n=1 Tax=Foetidibacter luteolus TaxID=2608880 RepID=UPI00129BACF1|nr:bifunctional 4-hydroxy-2-oxoglutarate aldolase/2-dehydro-3-deoxy-phosphogluconate aldolase [Foetidibacter luteolus]